MKSNKLMKIEDSYNYLLGMSIYSLTKEKVDEINNQLKKKKSEYKELRGTSESQLWLNDLEELKERL